MRPADDPVALALVQAVQIGDAGSLLPILDEHPDAAGSRIQGEDGVARTLLHVVTDWPGYFPNGPDVVRLLIEAGADPSAPLNGGANPETPLHWAASSDDVEVAEALIDGGADLEAPGASIAGGPPLDDAVGYGCWHVARLLTARGAKVDKLWHAAALGLTSSLDELLAAGPAPEQVNEAFWQACHAGQRRIAEKLLRHGADIDSIPGYAQRSAADIATDPDTRRALLREWLRDQRTTGKGWLSRTIHRS
jgi:ankyrin repeat protein